MITLEMPSELESQIASAARARGTDPAAWLLELARRALDPEAAFDALVEELPDRRAALGLAPLTGAQLSRAAFYDDDGSGEADRNDQTNAREEF